MIGYGVPGLDHRWLQADVDEHFGHIATQRRDACRSVLPLRIVAQQVRIIFERHAAPRSINLHPAVGRLPG